MQKRPMSRILQPLVLALLLTAAPSFALEVSRFTTETPSGLTAELTLEASPLKTMKATPFTLSLKDDSGANLSGWGFTCDLTMPAMPMPQNRPKVTAHEQNYSGYVVFTMAGAWQATFTARDANQTKIQLVFDIPEVLLK